MCKTDSDGDGRTNGEELGDPQCIWTEGSDPTRSYGITHPGIVLYIHAWRFHTFLYFQLTTLYSKLRNIKSL